MDSPGTRHCPLCHTATPPVFRAVCRGCFIRIPPDLRNRLVGAWRRRIVDPTDYQEVLADVRSRWMEFGTRPTGNHSGRQR